MWILLYILLTPNIITGTLEVTGKAVLNEYFSQEACEKVRLHVDFWMRQAYPDVHQLVVCRRKPI